MDVVKLTEEKYKEWDDFCMESDDAWFWQTSEWLEYTLNYKPLLKPESKSFMVFKNNQIVAICPLILENYENIKEFSFGGDHGPVPAFANSLTVKERHDVEKFVFEHIDNLAKENNVSRARFRFTILNKSFIEAQYLKFNFLMKFGYINNSLNTQIINIKQPIEKLKNGLRHGHRSDIDRANKILKSQVFDKKNITKEIFNSYSNLHSKAAGRITRPKKTFDIMYSLIEKRNAFLIGAKKDNIFVGFSYFFVYKNNVYYGSSCTDPISDKLPVSHFIQWAAIEEMQNKKFSFYEIGWQYFSNEIYDLPDKKQIDIAKFKRGFGGLTVPLFRGEKFYNKEYFLKTYRERINNFADFF